VGVRTGIADLDLLLAFPVDQVVTHADTEQARMYYVALLNAIAGYYVRGMAEFFNAGVQAERERVKRENPS
jgi:hypothetical protein